MSQVSFLFESSITRKSLSKNETLQNIVNYSINSIALLKLNDKNSLVFETKKRDVLLIEFNEYMYRQDNTVNIKIGKNRKFYNKVLH